MAEWWRDSGGIIRGAALSKGKKVRFTIPWPRRGFSYMKRYAKDLTADDILTYEPNTPVDIYGMAIGVKPRVSLSQKRLYGERLILGVKSVLLDLAKRGIIIRRIIAHSFTPDGIRLMKHIGFTETPPKAPGLRDFMIDIESSGIPFLRVYKEVLKNSLQSAQDQVL